MSRNNMSKNTSITLGEHFDSFVATQINSKRFATVSEVVRAGLRMLEDQETKLAVLRQALEDGERSGVANYTLQGLLAELDQDACN